jgi:beta-glucosidase/6-phospho-beta-glucosidase/beta-galactosidase
VRRSPVAVSSRRPPKTTVHADQRANPDVHRPAARIRDGRARGGHVTAFMFATGIECSYPMIRDRTHRVDALETTRHYARWREDLHLTRELGLGVLRYGVPYHRMHRGPGRYDWAFADEVFAELRGLGITPIVDLCHFGMPDWLGNSFQNPEFPTAFAEFAGAFAARYPWVTLYTPVNEIFICAKFSALFGWWNEQERSERAYVTATRHLVQATLLAMRRILAVQPKALFVQSESSEYTHTACGCPPTRARADWENQTRFLALDLLYSREVRADVYAWLAENGMPRDEYRTYMTHGLHTRCVMGNDYYVTNERILQHDGSVSHVGEVFGWYLVTKDYYERYRKPVMHTETNLREDDDAVAWLWKQWQNILRMREEGVPVLGFTWYSLVDQVDWDTALREPNGTVNPLGLYDIDRKLRPVGAAYRDLVREFAWMSVVPNGAFLSVT